MGSETGAANTISFDPAQLPGAGGGWITVASPADAQITVGTIPNGYTVSSQTNAVAGLLPGLTVTLGRAGETVTIGSTRDSGKLADQVAGMVDTLNAALDEIRAQTKYDAATGKAAALNGNSTIRQIQNLLAEAISGTATSTPALAGIKLERDGKVTFDRAKFLEAYTRDPAGTQAIFSTGTEPGLAARLVSVVDRSINATDGLLTSAQGATTKLVDDLDDQIAKYQLRLDKRQVALRNQFTAMETALSSLQSQSQWLAGQLAGLV
jgi:flagellar hook-associated protein 2